MPCFHPKPTTFRYANIINEDTGEIRKTKILKFLNPLTENIDEFRHNIIMIPCGKCLGCRIDKANDWATRCLIEAKHWETNCFITLTYNNENLPKKRSLCKRDLQLFFKRLRKKYQGEESRIWKGKEEKPIRYFACGEYGPKTKRPHYHIGLFNWKPPDLKPYAKNECGDQLYTSKILETIWGKGYVIIGNLTYESACYIARYVMKKAYGIDNKFFIKHNREPEFVETSRAGGIGYMALDDIDKIKRNLGIFVLKKGETNARLKKLPNYIRNKWREIDTEEYYSLMDERANKLKEETKLKLSKTDKTPDAYRKQQEEKFLQQMKLLKREQI